MKIPEKQTLYIRSMGKALRITAIFLPLPDGSEDVASANAHMAKSSNNDGLVSEFNNILFLADVYDNGIQIGRK